MNARCGSGDSSVARVRGRDLPVRLSPPLWMMSNTILVSRLENSGPRFAGEPTFECLGDGGCSHVKILGLCRAIDIVEVEVVYRVDRRDVQVYVWDLETSDHETDLFRLVDSVDSGSDALRYLHEMRCEVGVKVDPMLYLCIRYDKGVPGREWFDGEERRTDIVSVDKSTGDLPVENHREHRCHTCLSCGDVGARE